MRNGESHINANQLTALLIEFEQNARQEIQTSTKDKRLLRSTILGSKSEFARLSKMLARLSQEDRPRAGALFNQVKQSIENMIENKRDQPSPVSNEDIDETMPGHRPYIGHLHPTTIVIEEMNDIFRAMGFSIYDGPEIETDEYNYDRLNLPKDHPARDLQDTLYIEEPEILLRTHTSSLEAHILMEYEPPFRFVVPGKVYRYENANATNNIMFYQYEGIAVGEGIAMTHLKGTLDMFIKKFFGDKRESRFRCKYYPQVEPGVGVDISCNFCNKTGCALCKGRGWIEMLGAGMVHPNMFRKVGLNPDKISGFAWGMGLDRIVMQRFGITDIRSLYNGDISYKD
jgi:phenylalanyl-tRNA synthetase alpha chain